MVGLIENFSRLLILSGHGSATENNPYASALDCGACGGNHGGPNAKILAAILNDSEVRTSLKKKGITILEDALCIAAEHNTTTDEVVLYDYNIMTESHKRPTEQLKIDLAKAGDSNSQNRCTQFGLKDSKVNSKKQVLKRSSDWAEVRPEWGLARNAAFIIGPRTLTKSWICRGAVFCILMIGLRMKMVNCLKLFSRHQWWLLNGSPPYISFRLLIILLMAVAVKSLTILQVKLA
ncbi:MAG: DUF2309 family protein [Parachlamydiaceae bacterium]|nr:DUF2309 family protein [Parachlamydiaceae bacterium]